TARWQGPVTAARSGSETLIVWNERVGDANQTSLMAARIGTNGAILDPQPRQLAASVVQGNAPQVIWDGSSYVVGWLESLQTSSTFTFSVVTQRVDKNGTLQGTQTRYEGPNTFALGSNGSSSLLAFSYPDGRGTNFVLTSGASVQGPTPLDASGYAISIGSIGG